MHSAGSSSAPQKQVRRKRVGPRAVLACSNCKDRKLRCDDRVPTCRNCQRLNVTCLVEDPITKRQQPRNYTDSLEQRIAQLEGTLAQQSPQPSSITGHDAQRANPEDASPADVFASRLATLGFNAAGVEPRYLGHSSALSFSRLISSSLLKAAPLTSKAPLPAQSEQSSQQYACLLPEYTSGVVLSNAYFSSIQQQYPFLHEPTFRAWEIDILRPNKQIDESDYRPLFFLYAVYAIGAILLPHSGHDSQRFFTSAQLYIDYVLPLDNLESIQALLCCAIYSLRAATGPSIWKLSGLALRQCIDLGYHRTASRPGVTTDLLRLQMQRRAFWVAFTIDCSQSTTLGRPLGVPVYEVTAEYPYDLDDTDITPDSLLKPPRSSRDEPPTSMSVAIHVFRSRQLWARIHTDLLSEVSPRFVTSDTFVEDFRAELETWYATRPPVPPSSKDALVLFGNEDWFSTNYSFTILLLYRVHLTRSAETVPENVFFDCFEAAGNVCRRYRQQFVGRSVGYTWQALHFLFLAGLTYLHCLWTSPALRRATRHDQVSSTCMDCTILLAVMAERWDSVAPYRDIFEALTARTISMMVDRLHEAQSNPIETGPAGGGDLDWDQWIADITDTGMSGAVDKLLMDLRSNPL